MSQPDTTSFYYVSEEIKEANRESNKADVPDLTKCSDFDKIVLREDEPDDELLEGIYDQSKGMDKFRVNVDDYSKGDSLFCMYRNVFYRAKIIGILRQNGQKTFKIHYHGWGSRYDEQVNTKDAISRFRPFDETTGALDKLNENQRISTGKSEKSEKTRLPKKAKNQEKEDTFDDLPRELAKVLLTDRENSKNGKNPKIPARVTMQQIVDEYKETMENSDAKYLHLFVDSILHGFDKYARVFLLYKNEWPTYDTLKESSLCGREFVPHNHYGFIHLLRACSTMDKLYTKVNVDASFIEFSKEKLPDFLSFLAKNVKKYYGSAEDYQ
jgi:mortality factor 4-like protein 1